MIFSVTFCYSLTLSKKSLRILIMKNLVLLLLFVSCASSEYVSKGRYNISCKPPWPWDCRWKAEDLCPQGYETLHWERNWFIEDNKLAVQCMESKKEESK